MNHVRATIRGGRRTLHRIEGAGDVVETVIRVGTFGLVKPCVGCDKRKKALNDVLPNPFRGDSPAGAVS